MPPFVEQMEFTLSRAGNQKDREKKTGLIGIISGKKWIAKLVGK